MRIRSIKFYNFGIYAGEQTIVPCAIEGSSRKPITLVGGYNGRGKTSLLEAVLLVLYGNRSRIVRERKLAYSSYLESLMHQGPDLEATQSYVEIEFDLYEGDEIIPLKVHRSWQKANVRAVERLKVWVNGAEDSYVAENWDTYVEGLIPSAIAELFFFDGERISELAESDETVESLQTAIRALLGLEFVDRVIKDLVLVIRKHQKSLNDSEIEEKVDTLQKELALATSQLKETEDRLTILNNQISDKTDKQNDLETKYLKSGGNLLESRDNLLAKRDEIRNRLSDVKAEMNVLFAGPLPFLLVQKQLQAVNKIVQDGQKIDRAKMALPIVNEQNERLLSQLAAMDLGQDVLNTVQAFIKHDQKSLAELANHKPVIPVSHLGIAQLNDLLTGLDLQLAENANEIQDRYEATVFELEQVERHLLVEVDQENITRLLEKLAQTRLELVELEQEKSRLLKKHSSLKHQIELLENKIIRTATELGGVEQSKRIMHYGARVQESYRLFRERLTMKKINVLAESVTDAFVRLTHKTTLVHQIQVDPESFRFSLWTASGQEISKAKLSSGERQMLAVAILWGLGRVSGRKLPVIIDTPMGRLDSMHRLNFVQKYLPHASHQVIVLSTDTEIVDQYLDSVRKYTGRKYLLQYNEQTRSTQITSGYFDSVGVKQ